MKATRRMYTVALGAAGLVLAGSMVGAVAYAANGGPSGNNDNPWSQGLSGGMMGGGWADGSSGGMMGQGWNQGDSTDTPAVTLDQATKIASDWVAAKYAGATLDSGLQMPMGYVFVASKDGTVVAHVMVNDDTGKVFAVNGGNFGGMMGGWNQGSSTGTAAVTLDQATKIASDWVASKYPGATIGNGTQMPIGYLFVASKDGKVVAHVMVNDDTGQVFASNGRNFGGMMGRGWSNGPTGTAGGGMMGQGRPTGSSMMSGRSA
jgi:hypothetical protein